MIVASILLLGMKPIGYTLMMANAVVQLLWAIVGTIVGIAIVGAQPSSFISLPFQIAFPVAVLIVLTRPNIKAAFRERRVLGYAAVKRMRSRVSSRLCCACACLGSNCSACW
jgi:hypothetical protein